MLSYFWFLSELTMFYATCCLCNRKNAEEAIQGLNGTVIGKQTVRLSWGRSPGNKHVSLFLWFHLIV